MKCESWRDLETLIINSEIKPLKNKIDSMEYQRKWAGAREKAQELWQELLEKNKKFFEKYGYLDIEFINGKYRRRPMSKGQPQKEESIKKDRKIVIRLDDELEEKLINYCNKHNVNISEAVREAIRRLY